MEIKKHSNEWIEGFAKEAMEMGLTSEQASELLKVASMQTVANDPSFVQGYTEEMQKHASVWTALGELGTHLLGGIKAHPFQALGTAALGKWGWDNYIDPYINQTADQRLMKENLMNRKGNDFTQALQEQANRRQQETANRYKTDRNRAKSLYDDNEYSGNSWWVPN